MNNFPDILQAARFRVSNDRPYLNAILWSLNPVPVKDLGTFAVDAYHRWYYDPDIKWNLTECCGALIHEINHIIRAHHARAEIISAHDKAWNVASDAEINDDLLMENIVLPDGCILPKHLNQPDGEMAEFYYKHIPVININIASDGQEGQSKPGAGKCGSASGTSQPWEQNAPGEANPDGSKGTNGVGILEGDLLRRQVAEDVKHFKPGKGQGDTPEWMKRWADDTLNPKVDWRKELAAHVRRTLTDIAGMVDYSYKRPSRRAHLNRKIIFPSLRAPLPNIAVVIDTSGSIGDEALTQAIAEVQGILKKCGLKDGLSAIVCDASVKSAKKVFNVKDIVLSGGGGTDMRIGINKALESKPKPHAIVVLTDGYTPWPDKPISAKLVVGIIGGGIANVPEWARAIEIKD